MPDRREEPLPTWATRVISRTERHSTGVSYAVLVEDDDATDAHGIGLGEGRRLAIWTTEVFFGATDSHCSGGVAFVMAAREQDRIATETWARLSRGEG